MCVSTSASFPCDITTPQRARDFTLACLRQLFPAGSLARDAIDDYLLVVSELATNAVRARCTAVTVTVEAHRDHVRIVAEDDAPGVPRLEASGPDDSHGRGLAIVAALARTWGVRPHYGGKQVWADLAIPSELAVAVRCQL